MEWFVGIDWANDTNQVELQTEAGTVEFNQSHSTEISALYELRDQLLEYADDPGAIRVGIEDPSRNVVRILSEAGMEVYIITPRKLDRLRDLYSTGQAKGDALDAHIICEELRVHRNVFYRLVERSPLIASLSRYYRAYQEAKHQLTQLTNRFRELLRDYFPQLLQLDWEVNSRVMLDLLELIPEPEKADEVTLEQIDEVLGRCRKHSAQEVQQILTGDSLQLPERLVETDREIALCQVERIRMAKALKKQWDDRLVELLEEISQQQKTGKLPSGDFESVDTTEESDRCDDTNNSDSLSDDHAPGDRPVSDIEIITSTPGIGHRIAAGVIGEGFEAIVAGDRQLLRRQSIAPVTKQTGKQSSGPEGPPVMVRRRYARNRHLNEALHHLGDSLQRTNGHYRRRYIQMKNERNHSHGRACRQIADQYLRVMFAMLRDRTFYDAGLHGATRR